MDHVGLHPQNEGIGEDKCGQADADGQAGDKGPALVAKYVPPSQLDGESHGVLLVHPHGFGGLRPGGLDGWYEAD
jgi:hypothetical protein